MTSKTAIAALAATLAMCFSANADTFNVSGTNNFAQTLTGTVEADAAFISITAVDLLVDASPIASMFTYPALDTAGNTYLNLGDVYRVYLSFPGGPSLTDVVNEIGANYNARVQIDQAVYDPLQCGTDLSCQAFVLAQLSAAIDQDNFTRNLSFFATATPVASVPSPIVGAGLPGLVSLLGGGLWWRRRKRQAA